MTHCPITERIRGPRGASIPDVCGQTFTFATINSSDFSISRFNLANEPCVFLSWRLEAVEQQIETRPERDGDLGLVLNFPSGPEQQPPLFPPPQTSSWPQSLPGNMVHGPGAETWSFWSRVTKQCHFSFHPSRINSSNVPFTQDAVGQLRT